MQDRKTFIKTMGWVALGTVCLGPSLMLTGCSPMINIKPEFSDGVFRVKKTEEMNKRPVFLTHPQLPHPIYLIRESENFNALSSKCTHRACTIRPAGKVLVCPCHGSEFAFDGSVLKGPARESLPSYKVVEKEDFLEIEIIENE